MRAILLALAMFFAPSVARAQQQPEEVPRARARVQPAENAQTLQRSADELARAPSRAFTSPCGPA
ncbi:MAG: hypothetical protein U0326_02820 [Polyangiales bacterium]